MSPSVGGTSWKPIKAQVHGGWDVFDSVLCDKNLQQPQILNYGQIYCLV